MGPLLFSECKSTHFFINHQNFWKENLKVKYLGASGFCAKGALRQGVMCNKKFYAWFLFVPGLIGTDCKSAGFIDYGKIKMKVFRGFVLKNI